MSDDLELANELRETTENMAHKASAPFGLWNKHSNAVIKAADTIERLTKERDEAQVWAGKKGVERDDAIKRAEKAERERDEARAALQWRPIETAPKDGRLVLVRTESGDDWSGTFAAYWSVSQRGWLYAQGMTVGRPAQWMPLPAAPDPANG